MANFYGCVPHKNGSDQEIPDGPLSQAAFDGGSREKIGLIFRTYVAVPKVRMCTDLHILSGQSYCMPGEHMLHKVGFKSRKIDIIRYIKLIQKNCSCIILHVSIFLDHIFYFM